MLFLEKESISKIIKGLLLFMVSFKPFKTFISAPSTSTLITEISFTFKFFSNLSPFSRITFL